MLTEVRTGIITAGDGSVNPARAAKDGSLIVGAGLGDYQELAQRGMLFQAANQAATTTSVGLTTTQLGICINNPAGSGKNLVMLLFGLSVVGAPAAVSAFGLQAGYAAGGVITHTTPLTPISTLLSAPVAGAAKADAACTTVGTPVIFMPLGITPITGATANVVNPPVVGNLYDLKGSLIVSPGGWVALYTSTALSAIGSFIWAEVPLV